MLESKITYIVCSIARFWRWVTKFLRRVALGHGNYQNLEN